MGGGHWKALPESLEPSDETEDILQHTQRLIVGERGAGLHAPPCPGRGGGEREARPGQSMPGSEEPEDSKSCQRCIIDEAERKGRGERRERVWLLYYKMRPEQTCAKRGLDLDPSCPSEHYSPRS